MPVVWIWCSVRTTYSVDASWLRDKFLNLEGIGEIPIRSIVHYITAGESTSTNGLKYFILYLKSAIAVGETEVSNLYKTFPDLLL